MIIAIQMVHDTNPKAHTSTSISLDPVVAFRPSTPSEPYSSCRGGGGVEGFSGIGNRV